LRQIYLKHWKDPNFKRVCLIDAIGITIISVIAGGFVGLLVGLKLAGI